MKAAIELPNLQVINSLVKELNEGMTKLQTLYEDEKVSNTECIVAVAKLIGLCTGMQQEAILLVSDYSQLTRLANKPKNESVGIMESLFGPKSGAKN
jgi:hypothetical protein